MATALTPSKISDYFPPSPKSEVEKENTEKNNLEDRKNPEKGTSETYAESKEDPCLSTSSLLITPTSSPAKEEEKKTENQDCESKETEKESKSRKSLNEVLGKQDTETKPPVQNKRKGRRKKNKKTKTDSTTDVISNGPGKPKSANRNATNTETTGRNSLVTDYFPVRRSERKSKTDIDREKEIDLQKKILNGVVEGLEVVEMPNKGRGVVATKDFKRSDFVIEYAGDLISIPQAKIRDEKYCKDPSKGCYMYYFNFKGKKYCIDATEESGKLGRLLNHSKTSSNCHTKLVDVNSQPYLIIVASRDIKSGEELLYDYGDRSKASLESHPWLKS